MMQIIWVADNLSKKLGKSDIGFRDIAFFVFGRNGMVFTDFILLACQFGSNCAFVSFIISNISSVREDLGIGESIDFIVFPSIFLLLCFLCTRKSTAMLSPFALVGNIALLVGIATCLSAAWYVMRPSPLERHPHYHISHIQPRTDLSGFALFCGMAVFSLTAHSEVLSIFPNARSTSQYQSVLFWVMMFISGLYIFFSIVCAFAWGSTTQSNIFLNVGQAGESGKHGGTGEDLHLGADGDISLQKHVNIFLLIIKLTMALVVTMVFLSHTIYVIYLNRTILLLCFLHLNASQRC